MIHLVDSEGHQHNKCANCDLSMKFGSYVPYTRTIKKSEGDNQSKAVHRPPGAKTPPPLGSYLLSETICSKSTEPPPLWTK